MKNRSQKSEVRSQRSTQRIASALLAVVVLFSSAFMMGCETTTENSNTPQTSSPSPSATPTPVTNVPASNASPGTSPSPKSSPSPATTGKTKDG